MGSDLFWRGQGETLNKRAGGKKNALVVNSDVFTLLDSAKTRDD